MKKYKIELECGVDGDGDVWIYDGYIPLAIFNKTLSGYVEKHGTPIEEPVTYKVGDRFVNDAHPGIWYLVALCSDGPTYDSIALIGEDCVAFGDTVLVESVKRITKDVFEKLQGDRSRFTKIEDDK